MTTGTTPPSVFTSKCVGGFLCVGGGAKGSTILAVLPHNSLLMDVSSLLLPNIQELMSCNMNLSYILHYRYSSNRLCHHDTL